MTERTHNIYPYAENLERAEKTFHENAEKCRIDEQTKTLIKEFIKHHIMTNGLVDATKTKFYYDFGIMFRWISKPLTDLDEQDMKDLCERIREAPKYSERTKEDYFVKLKQFFKWLRLRARKQKVKVGAQFDDAVAYLLEEYRFRINKDKLPKAAFLLEEDAVRLMDASLVLAHKTLFATLWASGCRIGELLTLQLRDVKPLSNGLAGRGFVIELRKSKTTERVIPLLEERRINTIRYLRVYMEQRKRDGASPEDALFVNVHGEPLEYRAAKKWLDAAARAANLRKRVHFHAFRKGRATDFAEKGWSGPQMNQIMGWQHGSRMPGVYIQRAGVDVTRKMAEDYGIVEEESLATRYLVCSGCGTENDPGRDYCVLCSRPIGPKALEAEQKYFDDLVRRNEKETLNRLRQELGLPTV